ncbi:hypothetical protein P5673_009913 [Acropora cervicornis]|uniref:Uncharacterized protein n=1 Tax=Acropora cervicornis TaxID=6130 RepID=A0AAD9V9N2_ACRCE|nr:hypothetical protein P5673_009913 [Acropora cervicornis]
MDLTPNWITVDRMNHRREKNSKDPLLTLLHKVSDWTSERKDTPEVIRAYWSFRDEISVQDDVPHQSYQVIGPASLRHRAHEGADSSIQQAHKPIYWQGMQAAIKETFIVWSLCLVPEEFTKGDKVYLKRWPTNKSQPWIYQEEIGKSIPRSFLVSKALGPVCQNHEKIRGAKAEPDDSHDVMMD